MKKEGRIIRIDIIKEPFDTQNRLLITLNNKEIGLESDTDSFVLPEIVLKELFDLAMSNEEFEEYCTKLAEGWLSNLKGKE